MPVICIDVSPSNKASAKDTARSLSITCQEWGRGLWIGCQAHRFSFDLGLAATVRVIGEPLKHPAMNSPSSRRPFFAAVVAACLCLVSVQATAARDEDLAAQQRTANSHFQAGDYANAARELQFEVLAAERAGRAPDEERLLLLERCYQQLNDQNAYAWGLEKLVAHYPKKEYWADLLTRTQKRPDFGERLALDVQRLRLLTGAMQDAAGYLTLANLAVQAGFANEAKHVLDKGFASGLLGTGPDAERHRKLRDTLARQASDEQQRLARLDAESSVPDGPALVDLGFAYVTIGETAKGLALMERTIAKGKLGDRPQYAKLHLGIAYLMAGRKARAIDAFKSVTGVHGAADLARLWGLYARNAPL
jgi:hypothetical protein